MIVDIYIGNFYSNFSNGWLWAGTSPTGKSVAGSYERGKWCTSIHDDVPSDSEEDQVEARESDTDSEQSLSDNDDVENTDPSVLYYIGKDKTTKWNKYIPARNVRNRSENFVVRLQSSRLPTRSLKESLDIWKYFVNDQMLDIIVDSTNIFIDSISGNYIRESDARSTNKVEIQALLGLLYYAGILKPII